MHIDNLPLTNKMGHSKDFQRNSAFRLKTLCILQFYMRSDQKKESCNNVFHLGGYEINFIFTRQRGTHRLSD